VQLSGRRRGSAGRFRIRFYIKYTNNFLKKQKRFGPNQEKPVYKLGAARILIMKNDRYYNSILNIHPFFWKNNFF
jgi:hypothetical protein